MSHIPLRLGTPAQTAFGVAIARPAWPVGKESCRVDAERAPWGISTATLTQAALFLAGRTQPRVWPGRARADPCYGESRCHAPHALRSRSMTWVCVRGHRGLERELPFGHG